MLRFAVVHCTRCAKHRRNYNEAQDYCCLSLVIVLGVSRSFFCVRYIYCELCFAYPAVIISLVFVTILLLSTTFTTLHVYYKLIKRTILLSASVHIHHSRTSQYIPNVFSTKKSSEKCSQNIKQKKTDAYWQIGERSQTNSWRGHIITKFRKDTVPKRNNWRIHVSPTETHCRNRQHRDWNDSECGRPASHRRTSPSAIEWLRAAFDGTFGVPLANRPCREPTWRS